MAYSQTVLVPEEEKKRSDLDSCSDLFAIFVKHTGICFRSNTDPPAQP